MDELVSEIERLATGNRFSGVVRVDRRGVTVLEVAFGLADRAHQVANTATTRFGIASGTKGLTAMTVLGMVASGTLDLTTTARAVLGTDLPLIDDRVTVEQLLAHRSGIGDYLDEDEPGELTDYVMAVPVHRLSTTEAYLEVLDGHETKFAPGERFSYCNGGYVVLALIAERAAGSPFADLVDELVCQPAGMTATAFLRSDELPGDAATGYLGDGLRTNVLHLPVRGSGDGGIFTTGADIHALWAAFFGGRIVPEQWVMTMTRPTSSVTPALDYGLGLWLHTGTEAVELHGFDAGTSFRSVHSPHRQLTWTVLSNTSDGAEPVSDLLAPALPA
jgi:CubicO group peptidase (beta-lactamase class C family)